MFYVFQTFFFHLIISDVQYNFLSAEPMINPNQYGRTSVGRESDYSFVVLVETLFYDSKRIIQSLSCLGTAITRKEIITMAECIPSNRLGTKVYDKWRTSPYGYLVDTVGRGYNEWAKNKKANELSSEQDVVILRLISSFQDERIRPILFPKKTYEFYGVGGLVANGWRSKNSNSFPQDLKTITPLLSLGKNQCKSRYFSSRFHNDLTDGRVMCTDTTEKTLMQKSDRGSPLVHEGNVFVGISVPHPEPETQSINIFLRINFIRQYINDQTNNAVEEEKEFDIFCKKSSHLALRLGLSQ